MAELDVMPGMDKLASINPDFDVNELPDFEEDAPKKKKKKNKKNKRDKNTSKKTKSKKTSNIYASSNDSNKSESKSKLQRTPKQISNKKTSSKKKQKKKTQPRKTSSIRDRIKQYDTMTKKVTDDMNKSSIKKRSKSKENTNKKTKNNTDKKSKKKKRKKHTDSKTKKKNTAKNQKQSEQTSKPETNTNKQPESKISQEPTLIKQIGFTSNHSNGININNINNIPPIASKTENAETGFNFDEKQAETNDRQMSSEAQMLASISPMTSEHLEYTALYSGDTMDTVKIYDSDSDIELENKSAVNELNNKHVSIEPVGPPAAYGIVSLDLPSAPEDISKDISFEAMYEPAYRHDTVKFKSLKRGNGNHGSDGDVMRDVIKQQIAEKEEKKAKLKRKQSKTTAFDKKNVSGVNLWGRKMNTFAIKNGQQMIVEWRFVTSDDNAHTLVLQHEQIKKKKKSMRMVILDGNEKYSDKSKKMEFKINVDGCIDVLNINIECQDEKAMKYNYRLKINNVAYSAVFFKWSKANK